MTEPDDAGTAVLASSWLRDGVGETPVHIARTTTSGGGVVTQVDTRAHGDATRLLTAKGLAQVSTQPVLRQQAQPTSQEIPPRDTGGRDLVPWDWPNGDLLPR
jgi:hypothetical protein